MWIQDPKPPGPFSSEAVKWTQNVAYIPFSRLQDFITGESNSKLNPTIFIPRKRYMRVAGSVPTPTQDTYLEHIHYHCAFGGTDVTRKDKNITCLFVMRKKESGDRGCLCHFEVKRLYLHPHVAKITYEHIAHVDSNGDPCHEMINTNCINKAILQTMHISAPFREWVISRLELKFTPQQIITEHREIVQNRVRRGGAIPVHTNGDYLTDTEITNISETFLKGRLALQKLDEHAVLMWNKRYEHKVFFYEQLPATDNKGQAGGSSFVIGIQTTWQKRKMLNTGHDTLVLCETTYGSNKLQYKVFTILVVDPYSNGIPVAWVITPNIDIKKHDTRPWMEALRQSIRDAAPDWKPQSFVADNSSSSIKEIRPVWGEKIQVFCSLRRIKRAWRKKLTTHVKGWSTRTMLFERLGAIMDTTYAPHVSQRHRIQGIIELVEELFAECLDCEHFIDYFQKEWMDARKIRSWAKCLIDFPSANMQTNAATESYLANLKRRNLCCKDRLVGRRISWLLDSLICDVEPQYLYLEHMNEERSSRTVHQEKILRGVYHRARSIPDDYVELPTYGHEPAKVRSTSKPYVEYLVYNGHHEWACCTCAWSRLGDLCKHVVKVVQMYSARNALEGREVQTTTKSESSARKLPTYSVHMMNLQAAREEGLGMSTAQSNYSTATDKVSLAPLAPLENDESFSCGASTTIQKAAEQPQSDEAVGVVELNKEIAFQEAELHNMLADNPALTNKYLILFQELKNELIRENQDSNSPECTETSINSS